MTILAVLLMMQAAPVATPMPGPTPAADEVVVVGRRLAQLKRLRMTTKTDRRTGTTRCIFKRRSGDAHLDAAVCGAVLDCVPKVTTVPEMQACIAPTMNALTGKTPWTATAAKEER